MTVLGRHRRPPSPVWRGAVVTAAWLTVVLATPALAVPGRTAATVHTLALFAHLASVLLGFGAVLLVDWFGLLWLAGRRSLADVLRTAEGAHVPTWLGFAGLLGSGVFLGPPAGVKMVAVLVIGLNGVYAGVLLPRLGRHAGTPPAGLLVRSVVATTVSQAAWWTAVVAGFLTAR